MFSVENNGSPEADKPPVGTPASEVQTPETSLPFASSGATQQSNAAGASASPPASEEPQSETPESLEGGHQAESVEALSGEAAAAYSEASEMGNLFESMDQSMDQIAPLAPGGVLSAEVLKVTDNEVILDIGLKSEAAVSREEFLDENGEMTVKRGDKVDVLIESYDEEDGTISVSHRKAAHLKAWDDIERAYQSQSAVHGRVVDRTKGGLEVDIGVRAFLPASQTDVRPLRNLDSLVGQEITCKIAKLDRKRNNVVVSRKAALEQELVERKSKLLEKLVEGTILTGRVKNLVDYGAFVDLGGMDGLLHITDLSWGRVSHPSEAVQVGQELQVKVLKYVPEKERVSLGLKQLTPDPWENVASLYHTGDRVRGRVVSVTDYGAFVEVMPGVEGLIHISEMTWSKRLKHPSKVVNVNDQVDAVVLDVNPGQRRISLSLRQSLGDPWFSLGERLGVGAVVEGHVRNLTDFGAFVEVEEGVDGLIHLSDLSWTRRVKHPSEVLKKGQKIEAVVLALDPEHRRLSLGLKQMQPDAWETFFTKTQVGDVLHGKVVRIAPFGAFVELEEGIEGLCHISEMEDPYSAAPARTPAVGSERQFRVIRLSPEEKRIGLSLNGVEQDQEPAEPAEKIASSTKEPSPAGQGELTHEPEAKVESKAVS